MKKGFTLIELMVVISLMGLLSFIVLSSIGYAREKGKDSAIQSQFATLKAQAERYYSKYDKYDNGIKSLCYDVSLGFGGVEVGALKELEDITGASKIELGNETGGNWNQITCHVRNIPDKNFDAWVVEVPMSGSSEKIPVMYCIDSKGLILKKNTVLSASENIYSTVGFSCVEDGSANP